MQDLRQITQTFMAIAVSVSALSACSRQGESQFQQLLPQHLVTDQVTDILILPTSTEQSHEIRKQAMMLGLKVEGDAVLRIQGLNQELARLEFARGAGDGLESFQSQKLHMSNSFSVTTNLPPEVIANEAIGVIKPNETLQPNEKVYYLAKKEFGLPDYWSKNPTHDGRGVKVGVIDDGISPVSSGFQKTTDGQRKFIAKKTTSDLLTLTLKEVDLMQPPQILQDYIHLKGNKWHGEINEAALNPLISWRALLTDLNGDGKKTTIEVAVIEFGVQKRVCVDVNVSQKFEPEECFGTFEHSGEYGFWDTNKLFEIIAEFDEASKKLMLTQGERGSDSHGEGVASVLAGHKIAGQFDGVAPGAQIVDYDFTEQSATQAFYTIGDFINAIEWLGSKNVEVANISYSIFFTSAAGQAFMKKALTKVVEHYNMVVSFSAGNNGPGLGSLNRRLIYPDNVLVAGAFVSQDLDEYVHGVTGLPADGRVVWYSSRGPGPLGGDGPTVISPLASLAHSNPQSGFMPFSGTSSASPALAGLATVLISSVKQLGLNYDASAIVHAIRMSGQPISTSAYIDQGYGLPNINRALEIYKTLIKGEQFTSVDVQVTTAPRIDGQIATGLLLKSSNLKSEDHRVAIKGVFAKSVPAQQSAHILKTVLLRSNASWLSQPQRLWLSTGSSSFFVSIDATKALAEIEKGGELNGEIEVVDEITNQVLHIIPVTVVDNVLLNKTQEFTIELGSEEGRRHHLEIPAGVAGYLIKTRVLQGGATSMALQPYNSSGVKMDAAKSLASSQDWLVPVQQAGFHQMGYLRSKGGTAPAKAVYTLTPIQLEVKSLGIDSKAKEIQIINYGEELDGVIALNEQDKLLQSGVYKLTKDKPAAQFELVSPQVGKYRLDVQATTVANIVYESTSCMVEYWKADSSLVKRHAISGSDSFEVKAEDATAKITVICRPFDQTPTDAFGMTWMIKLWQQPEKLSNYKSPVRIRPGLNTLKLNSIVWNESEPPVDLDVSFDSLFGIGKVKLGTITKH